MDKPVSLYAFAKKSDELMAHAYSKLYNIPSTGLRFFTVYGPAGRPDMAYFGFTNKLLKGETIQIFNYGNCKHSWRCWPFCWQTKRWQHLCRPMVLPTG